MNIFVKMLKGIFSAHFVGVVNRIILRFITYLFSPTLSLSILTYVLILNTGPIHATDIVSNRPYGCAWSPNRFLLLVSFQASKLGCCSTVARAIHLNNKYMLTKLKSWCSDRALMFGGSFCFYCWDIEHTGSVGCGQCQSCGCLPTRSHRYSCGFFFPMWKNAEYPYYCFFFYLLFKYLLYLIQCSNYLFVGSSSTLQREKKK